MIKKEETKLRYCYPDLQVENRYDYMSYTEDPNEFIYKYIKLINRGGAFINAGEQACN